MNRMILVAVVLLVGTLVTGSQLAAGTIYGTTATGVNMFALVEIDTNSGATSPIGDPFTFWTSLDFSPDGSTLYAVNEQLFVIDPSDGSFTEIGSLTYDGTSDIGTSAMSVSPSGEIYVISSFQDDPSGNERLYTVDASSGAMTLVGELDQSRRINAMEFAADGTLYGVWGDLYILDPNTGSILETVGDLGGPHLDGFDINSDGQMIGLNDFHNQLYTIDPGRLPGTLATQLVTIQDDEVYSIASGPTGRIPEPATHLLTGICAILGLGFPRLRRAYQ